MRSLTITCSAVCFLASWFFVGSEYGHAQKKPVAKARTIEEHQKAM